MKRYAALVAAATLAVQTVTPAKAETPLPSNSFTLSNGQKCFVSDTLITFCADKDGKNWPTIIDTSEKDRANYRRALLRAASPEGPR